MRAHLLSSVVPALALLAAACGPAEETDTSEMTEPEAAETESEPAEVAAAEAPAEPEPAPAAAPAEPEPAAAAAATTAAADEELEAAQAAIELRQAPMKLLGWNMGPLGGMLRGSAPFDAAVVETNTARMAVIAPMIPGVFSQDVRSFDLETRALPSIWDNKDDFDSKAMALAEAAMAASAAAATGDEAATMMALGAVGQACGGCHDDYRAE